MSLATNLALNAHAAALNTIEQLDKGFKQALDDLRALKEGTKLLSELTIVDDGYEFIPAEPPDEEEPSVNGTSTDEISAEVR